MSSIPQSEIDAAIKKASQIPGMFRKDEMAFLYKLARRKGLVVEIGCFQGRSTSLLVQAAGKFETPVITIDKWIKPSGQYEAASKADLVRNFKRLKLPLPQIWEMDSHDAAEKFSALGRKISLLFIDGNHTYDGLAQDITDWMDFVQIGGIIAFHDVFNRKCPEVQEAISHWWTPEWYPLGLHDFTLAFRRMKDGNY